MKTIITLHDRQVHISLARKALDIISASEKPMVAEIDLIFGCMVAKRIWFKDVIPNDAVKVMDNLFVCFRSVRYAKTCRFDDIDNGAIPEEFPMVAEKKKFVPDWVNIDFRNGKLSGTFGYDRAMQQPDETAIPAFE